MGFAAGTELTFRDVRLDAWALRTLEGDLDGQIDALVSAGPHLPHTFRVALRADGGLWLVVGHDALSVVFAVPPDAWMPAAPGGGA